MQLDRRSRQPSAKQAKLVISMLAVGVLVFLGCAHYLRSTGTLEISSELTDILAWVALGLGVALVPAIVLVQKTLTSKALEDREGARSRLRVGALPPAFFQRSLITAALAEGLALYGVVIYLLGGPTWILALVVLGLGGILSQLPDTQRLLEELDRPRR